MSYETYTKRIVWEAKCADCELSDVRVSDPPKERQCNCTPPKWVTFLEQSYVGPDRFGKKP